MWNRIKAGASKTWDVINHWFRRCNGPDNLGMAILIASMILTLLTRILGLGVLAILSMGFYAWAIFRMLSQVSGTMKRASEKSGPSGSWI